MTQTPLQRSGDETTEILVQVHSAVPYNRT